MALNPAEMNAAIIANLSTKTGKSLEEWVELIQQTAPSGAKARIGWLKTEHGIGQVTARLLAQHVDGHVDDYVDGEADHLLKLFGAESSPMRTAYNALSRAILEADPGSTLTVCKGYVGIANARQFAVIRSKGDRLQVGLRLPPNEDDLAPVRGFGGGSITSSFFVEGTISSSQLDAVGRAASLERAV
jgi:Domain of unknown function (DUF4287)/Domain of unknown function (DUF5655)